MTTGKLWLTLCTSGFLFASLSATHAQLPPPPAPAPTYPAPAPAATSPAPAAAHTDSVAQRFGCW